MENKLIFEKVRKICAEVFDCDESIIAQDSTEDDIEEWDSLTYITLIGELEEAFKIKFSMEEVMNAKSIGELIHIMERKIK